MFKEQIFPLKYEENITVKFWVWKILSILHALFICFYSAIGIFGIIWILKIDDPEKLVKWAMLGGFSLFFIIFGFLFLYMRVFLKPLKPKPYKIVLSKETIEINNTVVSLHDIKWVLIPEEKNSFLSYRIYTSIHVWHEVKIRYIHHLDLFLQKNFNDARDYLEKEKDWAIQNLFWGTATWEKKTQEYKQLKRFSEAQIILWFAPLIALFIPSILYHVLLILWIWMSINLFFIFKLKLYKLEFLEGTFWCSAILVFDFFLLQSKAIYFFGIGLDMIYLTIFISFVILFIFFVKDKIKKGAWIALTILSILLILVSLNLTTKFFASPIYDELLIQSKEYDYNKSEGGFYKIQGEWKIVGYISNSIPAHLWDSIEIWDTVKIKTYQWLLWLNYYEF